MVVNMANRVDPDQTAHDEQSGVDLHYLIKKFLFQYEGSLEYLFVLRI